MVDVGNAYRRFQRMFPHAVLRGSEHGNRTPYQSNVELGPGDRLIAEIEFHPDDNEVIVRRYVSKPITELQSAQAGAEDKSRANAGQ